jgi:hypothetical protein
MSKPQVNLQMVQEDRDVLEAVAFVEERSVTEVLRPVVLAYVNKQRNDPDVQAALAALEGRRAKKEGRLTDIRRKAATADDG